MIVPNRGERRTGFARGSFSKPVSEFDSKLLDLARVTRVTAGGKHMRFRAVVVAGNKKGKVGVGVSKGSDVQQAVEKATRIARKHLIEVPIVNDTIPHEVFAKYGPARILLKPQRQGRGLVAGGTIRTICLLAGIKNISSKILGRTGNKLNNARATIEALEKLRIKKTKNATAPAEAKS
ncbi:MAG: 30S ribosomal protein S5 [bacterium]|nr:30S ribosomal protein S5 [bacterium]